MEHSNSVNAFGGTFAFLLTHKAIQKNAKEPPSHCTTNRMDTANLIQQNYMNREARTANIGFCNIGAEAIPISIGSLLGFGSGRSFSIIFCTFFVHLFFN
jgi:hypothetical protein